MVATKRQKRLIPIDMLVDNKTKMPKFDHRRKCWRLNGQILKGAHNVLEQWYWSRTGKKAPPLSAPSRQPTSSTRKPKKGRQHSGLENGKRIGRDLAKFLKSGKVPAATSSTSRYLHRYSLRFITAIKKWGYKIHAVEMPVAHTEAGVGTGVDVVLQNTATGKWKACELKCGFKNTWDVSSGAYLPFPTTPLLPDTHHNRATVQAILTHLLLVETLHSGALKQCQFTNPLNWEEPCVVVVNDDATVPYTINMSLQRNRLIAKDIQQRLQASC